MTGEELFTTRTAMAPPLLTHTREAGSSSGGSLPIGPSKGGHSMTRWISALLIVAFAGWVGAVSAQTTPPAAPPAKQAPAAAPAAPGEKMMEGKVKSADQ